MLVDSSDFCIVCTTPSNAQYCIPVFAVESADRFKQDLSSFDMRSVVNMTSMFKSALSFEGNGLEKWEVNNVVHMNGLFEEAISFSGTVGSWWTENAVDMSRLFYHATSFTDDLSSWMVDRVRIFDYAFNGARLWNSDISRWKIGSALSFVTMVGGSGFALFLSMVPFLTNLCSHSSWVPRRSIRTCVIGDGN